MEHENDVNEYRNYVHVVFYVVMSSTEAQNSSI